MRKKLVAGNWKMHGSVQMVQDLLSAIATGYTAKTSTAACNVAVFPPFPYLALTQQCLQNTNIAWGAQNLNDHAQGAYTGEVSAEMLLDFGCRYVILGHSERRTLYHESSELVAKKVAIAIQSKLLPILCVGESDQERIENKTMDIITRQLDAVLQVVQEKSERQKITIAYEPIWAIGTGKVATPAQAQEVHAEIRSHLAKYDPQLAQEISIVYGGSVKANNAASLFAESDIDGGLIGGAALNAQEFLEIIGQCHN